MMTEPKTPSKLNLEDFESMTADERQAFVDMFNQVSEQQPQPQYIEATLEETSKHWSESKTMWFNIGVTALGVASTVLPFAKPFIKAKHYGLITTAIGIGNMALRTVTKHKIK